MNDKPARLDADRTATPLTSIVHHPVLDGCCLGIGPLANPEYVAVDGTRIPLVATEPMTPAELASIVARLPGIIQALHSVARANNSARALCTCAERLLAEVKRARDLLAPVSVAGKAWSTYEGSDLAWDAHLMATAASSAEAAYLNDNVWDDYSQALVESWM